jgi:hypothetical protein
MVELLGILAGMLYHIKTLLEKVITLFVKNMLIMGAVLSRCFKLLLPF